MSERTNEREQNEQSGASGRVSGASERANGRLRSPVLTSRFLFVPDHSAALTANLLDLLTSQLSGVSVSNGQTDSSVMSSLIRNVFLALNALSVCRFISLSVFAITLSLFLFVCLSDHQFFCISCILRISVRF